MKSKIFDVQNLLWLALMLALIGSLKHLAAIFASIDEDHLMGWFQAVAIDAGLFALAYSIRIRKNARRSTWPLWVGVGLFSLISIYGNYAYGLLSTQGELPEWISTIKPIILAASLPILVLFLSELLSDDRQHAQAEAEARAKAEAKAKAKAEASNNLPPSTLELLDQANQARTRDKETAMENLLVYLDDNPEATLRQAGRAIGRSKATAGKYVTELQEAGRLHKNGHGWDVVAS